MKYNPINPFPIPVYSSTMGKGLVVGGRGGGKGGEGMMVLIINFLFQFRSNGKAITY